RDLLGARQGQLALGRVLGQRRAGAGIGARADFDRRHQHRAGADESVVAYLGAPLVRAVVVHSDAAGADVDLASERRVAEICQVIGLAALADDAVLHFDEVADVHFVVQLRARPHARERADRAARADRGAIDHAVRVQLGVRADAAILQVAVRADARAVAD